MLESYKVGVTLEMGGNALSSVEKLIANMETLDRSAKDAGTSFGRLAADIKTLGGAGASVGRLNAAMEKLSTGGAGKAVTDLERMAEATRGVLTATERLSGVLKDNVRLIAEGAKAMEAASRVSLGGGGPGGPGSPRQPGTARQAGHGGRFTSHDGMMVAMGATMVGEPVMHRGEDAIERAMEVAHLRTQIASDTRLGPDQAARNAKADEMVQRAFDATSAAPGTRVGANLESLIDLKNVTGSLDEAEKLLPKFAALGSMLALIDKRHGGSGTFDAAKAMELMGGMIDEHQDPAGHTVREINPDLLQRRLDMMARVAVATNGRVAPRDYLGFAKQARVAGMTLSDEFIYEKLPALMMGMGGPRAGTALMSMAQVFDGGKLTPKSMEALQSIGLASAGGITREKNPRTGKMRDVVHPEAIYDMDLMRHDPTQYVEAAQKRMEAKGITGTEAQIRALMTASQRTTIAGALADILKDAPVIEKEQANIRATRPDIAGYFATNDPAAKLQQMQAAFDKLLVTLGGASMDDAVRLMNAVTAGLNGIGDWARDHPTVARVLVDTGTGLGALAVGLGTISTAILMFGPALKLLGVSGGGAAVGAAAAAGGAGAAVTRGGALGLASRLLMGAAGGTVLGVGGLAFGTLAVGSHAFTPENNAAMDRLARERRRDPMAAGPQDGFGVDGRAVTAPPVPPPNVTLNLTNNTVIDSQVVAKAVTQQLLRGVFPSTGTTGFDIRVGPVGGLAGAAP